MKINQLQINQVSALEKLCQAFDLRFDKPGENANWKVRKGIYSVYFRSNSRNGNKYLAELRKAGATDTIPQTQLCQAIAKVFPSYSFEGGCADFGASFKIAQI